MPYIAVKSYPKDQATKEAVAEKINQVFLETWGCRPEAVTITFEEVAKEDWQERVVQAEIEPKKEYALILSGEKRYQ